jgi:hypothetical protein
MMTTRVDPRLRSKLRIPSTLGLDDIEVQEPRFQVLSGAAVHTPVIGDLSEEVVKSGKKLPIYSAGKTEEWARCPGFFGEAG